MWRLIYTSRKYWEELSLDLVEKLAPAIAEELADTGVNMGTMRAGEFLQRSLNVLNKQGMSYKDIKVDGDIGPRTVSALKAYVDIRKDDGVIVLHRALNTLQGAFYISLAERRQKDERFIFGWLLNRVS